MKVAFVYPHSNIPVEPSAAISDALAVVNVELARRLAKDCEVFVYPRRAPGQPRTSSHEGVTYHRTAVWPDLLLGRLQRLEGVLWRNPRKPFRTSPFYYPFFARQVARACREQGCDVIHLHAIANFLPIFRRENPTVRLVFHAHDHAACDFDHALVESWLSHADLIFSCSRFVTRNIARRFPGLAGRCDVLHNGADLERFSPRVGGPERDPAACRLLFVGRLSPEKGVHVLFDAFREVAAAYPGARLDLVGPSDVAPKQFVDPFDEDPLFAELGKYYRSPSSYLAALKQSLPGPLRARVRFLGPVPNAQLPSLYRSADVFVFPSLWQEPFGMPLVEAMASGLPVVATRSGAFPEIVEHGTTGLLAQRGDARSLARALDKVLSDPALRRQMGAAGRTRAQQQFSWDQSAARLLAAYRRLLGGTPVSPLSGQAAA